MLRHRVSDLTAVILFCLMAGTLVVSVLLRPREFLAKSQEPIHLSEDVPVEFSDWRLDPDIVPVMPDPAVLRKLSTIYSQVLARTYINKSGRHVMLSVAYGEDQSDDSSQVHRPEFCYAAQGFSLTKLTDSRMALGQGSLLMQRLIADRISRHENIVYWVVMSGKQISPGWQRKWTQVEYGLHGKIPDGVLMRVSTVDVDNAEASKLLVKFSSDLYRSMATHKRIRYFGV